MKPPRLAVLLAATLLPAATAGACPVCDRETGRLVRAGIFDEDFGLHLAAAALPFGVVLGVAALIHHGLPRRRDDPGDGAA